MNDTVQAASVPWYQSVIDNATKLGAAYLTLEQQKQLNALNLERARKGLAPLDATQYQTGVQVGVSSSTQNTLLMIAAGVGVVWLVTSLMGSRR